MKNTHELNSSELLLEIKNLNINFFSEYFAVRDTSFYLKKGETLGVVGESGSGKSLTNLALLNLLPENAKWSAEKFIFKGQSLPVSNLATSLNKEREKAWSKIRGKEIGMIFQDPMTAMNPFLSIEFQMSETIATHLNLTKVEIRKRCIELLGQVGITSPEARLKSYPFELSGGMAQRVMIAMAISTHPDILIADEPTTALDVTIEKQILTLIDDLRESQKMAVILVTHDLNLVSEYSDRIQVMYAGEIVESGKTLDVISSPRHPYTHALLASRPRIETPAKTILPAISGIVPHFKDRPQGCQFGPRCQRSKKECEEMMIPLESDTMTQRQYRCRLPIFSN